MISSPILTGEWWKAAAMRALRTAVILAIPYAPTVLTTNNYGLVASVAGFGALVSFITSFIKGIPEAGDVTVPWYFALLERVTKTAAQALLTAFGTATLFSEIHWSEVPALVGTAALGSLLIGVLGFLPEADAPTAAATVILTNPATDTADATTVAAPVVVSIPTNDDNTVTPPVLTAPIVDDTELDIPTDSPVSADTTTTAPEDGDTESEPR